MTGEQARPSGNYAKSTFFGGVATLLLLGSFIYPLVAFAFRIPLPDEGFFAIPATGTVMALILFVVGGHLPLEVIMKVFDLVATLRQPKEET